MPVPGTDFDLAEHSPAPDDHPLFVAADRAGATQYGFDYAWQSLSIAQLVRVLTSNGAQFDARYINDGVPGGKGLTAAEAVALQLAGITICPVYETTGADFTGGYSAGLSAGQNAAADMRARGAPAGSLCWFAIDTGTSDFGSTNAYLRGAKAGSGEYVAQLYGHYGVCEAAAAAGLGSLHWQTYAWSAGQVSSHALLYQYQNGVMIGGVSMDRDRTLQSLSGPWAHSGSAPAPAPAANYQVTAIPPGQWKAGKPVVFTDTGTDGAQWHTATGNGTAWTSPVPLSSPLPVWTAATADFSIAVAPPGWYKTGTAGLLEGTGTDNALWRTATVDGTSWEAVVPVPGPPPPPPPPPPVTYVVTVLPPGDWGAGTLTLTGPGSDGTPSVTTSTDGATWTPQVKKP